MSFDNIALGAGSSLVSKWAESESERERGWGETLIRGGLAASGPVGFAIDTYANIAEASTSRQVKIHRQLKKKGIQERLKKTPDSDLELIKKEADLEAAWLLDEDMDGTTYHLLKRQIKKN